MIITEQDIRDNLDGYFRVIVHRAHGVEFRDRRVPCDFSPDYAAIGAATEKGQMAGAMSGGRGHHNGGTGKKKIDCSLARAILKLRDDGVSLDEIRARLGVNRGDIARARQAASEGLI
jgi:hypothetical protein